VRISHVKDAGLATIESGMARYQEPSAYEMSKYAECLYKNAQDKAREAKRGLWQGVR
jgi:endonuclease YncB( thermonuclease family)